MKAPRRLVYVACLAVLCLAVAVLVIRHATAASPVIATVPVGMYPSAVAIDSAARRALVLNAYETTVSVLDEETGALLATTTVGSNGGAHPQRIALDTRTAHALVLTDDGLVNVLDTRSGRVLSTVPVGGSPSAVAVDDDWARAFVANVDGATVAIVDTRTGKLVRTVPVGLYPEEIVCDTGASRVFVTNQGDDTVSMLDARTGRPLHTVHLKDAPDNLTVSDRYHEALITGVSGSVTAVDVATGAPRFQRTVFHGTARDVLIAMDDARGVVLVAQATHIDELDPHSGRSVGVLRLPGAISALAVDPRRGDVIATVRGKVNALGQMSDGSALILDARGRPVSTIPVGVDPSALAVDPGNGRIFVANTNLNPDGSAARPLPAPHNALADLVRWLRSWLPGRAPAAPTHGATGSVTVLRLGAS